MLLPLVALAVVAGLALAAWAGDGDGPGPDTTPATGQVTGPAADAPDGPAESADELDEMLATLERREEGDPLALGAIDAPVLMIEWADFQGAFWELHDEIYAEDRARNAGELDRDPLIAMAARLGLDTESFESALDDPDHAGAVEADAQLARSLGVTGTPAFLINGQPLIGGQPTEVVIAAIEQATAQSDAS